MLEVLTGKRGRPTSAQGRSLSKQLLEQALTGTPYFNEYKSRMAIETDPKLQAYVTIK